MRGSGNILRGFDTRYALCAPRVIRRISGRLSSFSVRRRVNSAASYAKSYAAKSDARFNSPTAVAAGLNPVHQATF